ncbi:MAG: hypothetical protein IPK80_26165 [Nannocystis sp.]|nr:hypothetical protein [Nannocystis sp.]
MNFGAWVRLDEAEFPAAGGVLQARLEEGLVVYPRGKSAMVYYAGARIWGPPRGLWRRRTRGRGGWCG